MSDGLRDALQEQLADKGVPGVVTHYLLMVTVHSMEGGEAILTIGSDGLGMAQHFGMAAAAKLTAEQRYYAGDEDEEGEGNE